MEADRTAAEDMLAQLRAAVTRVFAISDTAIGYGESQTIRLRGQLLVKASEAYDSALPRFRALGYTPLFRREGRSDVILAVPGSLSTPSKQRLWVPALLFFLTVISVLFAGATMDQVASMELFTLQGMLRGWPFAVSLLSILAAHELGHYFVARRFGTPVSLPHFIPMPLNFLGTMGAVINMQAPPRNRRQLLLTGAAGPLAGIVLGIPILILGLSLSQVMRIPSGPVLIEGNSVLYILLKLLIFGRYLPSGGMDVFLHPVAFASWAALMITGINLLPVGQLDGGHIMYALVGRRYARWLNWVVIALLVALGFQWPGWFLWAGLLVFFSQRRTLILDEITDLGTPHKLLATLMMLLFILTFVPIPIRGGTL